MPDTRRAMRLRQHLDVRWNLGGSDISGQGTILNISLSGAFMQTDRLFTVPDKSILSIELEGDGFPATVKEARIVWYRQVETPQPSYQCGVEFTSQEPDCPFRDWINEKVVAIADTADANVLSNYMA